MADFTIDRIRGMNDNESPDALPKDICVLAQNVEWVTSQMGERRRGTEGIDFSGSGIVGHDEVAFLARHLPTGDQADAQLFALGVIGTSSSRLEYKDTTWHLVTPDDAIVLTDGGKYALQSISFRQGLYVAYKSAVDRLHKWDGTSLRRVGLAEPSAAPTALDTAVGGSFAGTRYYRVRWTRQDSGVTTLRSEPSDAVTFEPNGSFDGATVTRPTTTGSDTGITHWELEASVDNANFYVIATTVIATTTATDTTAFSPGYQDEFDLSEDIGDYTVPWSAEFLTADDDRLIWAGSHEDEELGSRVAWSAVAGSLVGVGNAERFEADTDPFKDLDPGVGGKLTGLSRPVNGIFYAFKLSHIYRMVRSGKRADAYDALPYTDQRGAVKGSIVNGVDQYGRPCVYIADPEIGPCRIGQDGLKKCGEDIFTTWRTVNVNASVPAKCEFYRGPDQWHLWVATEDSDTPNLRLVLQVSECYEDEDGVRGGWATWPGGSGSVLDTVMFADNIDDGTDRSLRLVPFIAKSGDGLIQRTDTGEDDNGTEFEALIRTRAEAFAGILNQAGVMAAAIVAKAADGVSLLVRVVRNFGMETPSESTTDLTPETDEDYVTRLLDDLKGSELTVAQFEFGDSDAPAGRWELEKFAAKLRKEKSA